MRIDILCKPESEARGKRVLTNVREALEQLDVAAEVHLYLDRRKMIDHRVYVAPALLVDDVDAEHARLAALGVEFDMPPTDAEAGIRLAFFRDPDGNRLEIIKLAK